MPSPIYQYVINLVMRQHTNIGYLNINWKDNINIGDKAIVLKGMVWIRLVENKEL
jgi:hypothetical protein